MDQMKSLDLLPEVETKHASGVSRFGRYTMVYELLDPDNRFEVFLEFLKRRWTVSEPDVVLRINLDGIDFIGPSASSALTKASVVFTQERRWALVLTNVRPEVLEGLRTCRYVQEDRPTICAIDRNGQQQFIGELPDRWREVLSRLDRLQAHGSGASASDLAELDEQGDSKRAVNRFSVYLQELFNAGLVRRWKVGGSERPEAERGWTYLYRPAYLDVKA